MSDRAAPDAGRRAPVVLAFDTAGSSCSVAVGFGLDVLAHERRDMRHGHAEALLPMVDRVVKAAGLRPAELDMVAVAVGPGGFTGIRAGLAAAQGLALATGARLIGVTSFAAVAALVTGPDRGLLVALDSRREDLYVQIFAPGGAAHGEPIAVLPENLAAFVGAVSGSAPLCLAGDAADAAAVALAGQDGIRVIGGSAPDAAGVMAAACMLNDVSAVSARPLYLRPPDVSFPKPRLGPANTP